MKITSLASSSAGNCYIIQSKNYNIMLECGIPVKKIQTGLMDMGLSLNDIDICLFSHWHKDHSLAYEDLKKRGVHIGRLETPFKNKNIEVIPMSLYHGKDTDSTGYLLTIEGEFLFFATDFSRFNNLEDLRMVSKVPLDYVMIECNFDEELIGHFTNDPKYLRQKNTHLGLSGCITYLESFNLKDCKGIYLMHLSDGVSNEFKMQALVHETTKVKTYVCKKWGGIQ